MAVEFPLVLYDCAFANLRWLYDRDVQTFNVTHLQQLWAQHAVKAQVLRHMLRGLDAAPVAAGEGKKWFWGENCLKSWSLSLNRSVLGFPKRMINSLQVWVFFTLFSAIK